jgi:Antitoxin SocA-like, Panacea domain
MARLEEAVHYIIASTTPEELGKTKLAKVLFFADLDTYRRTGRPITEAVYVKRQHGPMPEQFYAAISDLDRQGKIAQRQMPHFGYDQHQFWALRKPELRELSADDVATLAVYTRSVCDHHTAVSISDATHNLAWELADMGERIPFAAYMAAVGIGQPTPDEIVQIEEQLGA